MNDYAIHAQIITAGDKVRNVVKEFKTEAARLRWVDKMEESGRLVQVLAWSA